ncbi:hypothetical protein ED733_003271 [Metarhizium rileyi]|uniref:Peptidase S1 domain-containing protein n=1 Tax=Metarhizium rileyi (strain RCEF 4871) TaxID=1649241 RepID=A0A5C6G8B3_METRR|nr:hypothetical protein ED733_003271 [Metarhizium rileyi]
MAKALQGVQRSLVDQLGVFSRSQDGIPPIPEIDEFDHTAAARPTALLSYSFFLPTPPSLQRRGQLEMSSDEKAQISTEAIRLKSESFIPDKKYIDDALRKAEVRAHVKQCLWTIPLYMVVTSDGEVDFNSSDPSKPIAVDDVAILKLETPISECHGVEYAVLPADGSDPTADSEAVAVGWGQQTPLQESGNGEDVKERAEVTLTVHPRETCSQNRPLVGDRDTIVCAGGNGKGVCKGDSGGPLVDLQTGELIGISSFILNTTQGLTCGQAPAVFTRIGSFIPFINKNLGTSGYGGAETERLIEAPKVRDIGNKMYNACTGRVFDLRDKCPAGNEKCASVIDGLDACVKCMKAAKIDKSSSQVLQETYEEKKKQVFSCLDRQLDVEDI